MVAVFEEYFEEEYPFFLLLLAVFSASLIVYYGIEAPIDRWRQRRVRFLHSSQVA
jgi:peptidoglycan/LPS O-acetylase OafA/YrhL